MTRAPDPEVCPRCGSADVEVVPGHGRYGTRARAPRTVICYACRAIHEQADGQWVELVDR